MELRPAQVLRDERAALKKATEEQVETASYKVVVNAIEDAHTKGQTNCLVFKYVTPNVIKKLEEAGYKIEYTDDDSEDQRSTAYNKISWD